MCSDTTIMYRNPFLSSAISKPQQTAKEFHSGFLKVSSRTSFGLACFTKQGHREAHDSDLNDKTSTLAAKRARRPEMGENPGGINAINKQSKHSHPVISKQPSSATQSKQTPRVHPDVPHDVPVWHALDRVRPPHSAGHPKSGSSVRSRPFCVVGTRGLP